jgi:hypothetical protein
MSETPQKFLCDAVVSVNNDTLFITVSRVNDGLEFETGRGEVKYGSPRREWTAELIKHEIARAFGARSVEISNLPDPAVARPRFALARSNRAPASPSVRPVGRPNTRRR